MNLIAILTPPLLGAFIGYVTNAIAIKMLFRPLHPWRLFGIRLPMTPGVIPGKRRELAVSIGRMVGAQLLTPADIGKALNEAAFERELTDMIGKRVEELLTRDLGPLPTIVPKRFRASFEAGINILRWRTQKIIHSYLDSPEFSTGLGATISTHLEAFLARPLESWLPARHREHLFASLHSTMGKTLANPQTEAWLKGYLDARLEIIIDEGKSLHDLLPRELIDLILGLVERETPGLLAKAAQFAGEPAMRTRMATAIAGAIGSFIDSLGPMAALAKGFLSPELIEAKVNGYLEDKGDEIRSWLNNELTQERTRAVLQEKAASFLNRPLKELLANLAPETIETIKDTLLRNLLGVLQSPQTSASLTRLLHDALDTQTARPSHSILADLFGADGVHAGKRWTAVEILAIIRSAKSKRILDGLLTTLVDKNLLGQPLGPLVKLLPKEVQTGFCEYLVQQAHTLLLKEVPRLVEFVNIQRIVTRKVDSLDLLRLEGLLLGIMEEQFKYINLFGGLLGFIIGLANLLFLP